MRRRLAEPLNFASTRHSQAEFRRGDGQTSHLTGRSRLALPSPHIAFYLWPILARIYPSPPHLADRPSGDRKRSDTACRWSAVTCVQQQQSATTGRPVRVSFCHSLRSSHAFVMSPPTSSQPSPSGMNSHQSLSRFPAALRSSNGHTAVTSIFEDQETPLGVGLGCQLPRRNHTISSGTSRASTRRLAEHFEQPLHPASPVSTLNGRDALSASGPSSSIFRHHNPASPSKNSLQDILQMEDPAHEVEWEQAIQNEVRKFPGA